MFHKENLRAYLLDAQEAKLVSLSGIVISLLQPAVPGPEHVRPFQDGRFPGSRSMNPSKGFRLSVSRLSAPNPYAAMARGAANELSLALVVLSIFYEALRQTSARISIFSIHVETISGP